MLSAIGLRPTRHVGALFHPPKDTPFWLKTSSMWEKVGRSVSNRFAGGVLIVEVTKQVPAPPRDAVCPRPSTPSARAGWHRQSRAKAGLKPTDSRQMAEIFRRHGKRNRSHLVTKLLILYEYRLHPRIAAYPVAGLQDLCYMTADFICQATRRDG